MSVHPQNRSQILVFLPIAAARTIVARLEEHGYAATAVSTVPDAFDALRSDRYSLAVATRPEIDLVRAIHGIPVIDLDIFFHAVPSGSGLVAGSKRLDVKGFIERLESLLRSLPTRHDLREAKPTKERPAGSTVVSRWFAALRAFTRYAALR